jgi:hypothetical protein
LLATTYVVVFLATADVELVVFEEVFVVVLLTKSGTTVTFV